MYQRLDDAWFPVVTSSELKGDKPYGIQIVGHPLVFWRNKGKVSCVADICPHRSAPLSLGRVENGTLECKYHGWQFDGEGKCAFIPSQPNHKFIAANNCKKYPTVERYDTVWVWIGSADTTFAEAEERFPSKLFTNYDNPGWAVNTGCRDLEIDHGLMVENLLDPAHLPFTHEGTLAKRSDAQLMEMEVVYDTTKSETKSEKIDCVYLAAIRQMQTCGFKVQATRPNAKGYKQDAGTFVFIAPYISALDIKTPKFHMTQVHFSVPITPTKMRLHYFFYRNAGVFLKHIPGTNRVFQWMSDKIINQDVELLGGQQVRLLQGALPWKSSVSADTGGLLYRKWRAKTEKNKPWFGGFSANNILQLRNNGELPFTEIEDLVTSCVSLYAEPASSQFKTRGRLPLIPPTYWYYIFAILSILILVVFVSLYY